MPPKRISRTTTPIVSNDKLKSFVGIIDGKPALVDMGSGIEDESMLTGMVDAESLIEMGYSDDDIAKAQNDLDERIDTALFGDSPKAHNLQTE